MISNLINKKIISDIMFAGQAGNLFSSWGIFMGHRESMHALKKSLHALDYYAWANISRRAQAR